MLRRLLPIGLPAALLVITSSPDTSAADACIASKTIDSLSSCPGIEARPVTGRRPPVKFGNPPKPATTKDVTRPPPPSATGAAAQLRRNLASARGTQLLVTQIQGLEALLASTPKTAPDRPLLIRRLGDSYVEL